VVNCSVDSGSASWNATPVADDLRSRPFFTRSGEKSSVGKRVGPECLLSPWGWNHLFEDESFLWIQGNPLFCSHLLLSVQQITASQVPSAELIWLLKVLNLHPRDSFSSGIASVYMQSGLRWSYRALGPSPAWKLGFTNSLNRSFVWKSKTHYGKCKK